MDLFIIGTKYLFWVGFVGMAAGALYFFMERNSLTPKLRSTATISGLVCFVAAIHYFGMKSAVGTDASIDSLVAFPTEIRYIDWLITTPLLLIKFPALLGFGNAAKGLLTKLIVADIIMIVTGYVGETAINRAGATGLGWTMWIVAMVAWFYIVATLYKNVSTAAADSPKPIQKALGTMQKFILFGWAIYPLGYVITLFGAAPELLVAREFVYNIADLVNKVGFGLVAVFAVKAISETTSAKTPAVSA